MIILSSEHKRAFRARLQAAKSSKHTPTRRPPVTREVDRTRPNPVYAPDMRKDSTIKPSGIAQRHGQRVNTAIWNAALRQTKSWPKLGHNITCRNKQGRSLHVKGKFSLLSLFTLPFSLSSFLLRLSFNCFSLSISALWTGAALGKALVRCLATNPALITWGHAFNMFNAKNTCIKEK